jgi:hypothetical protein
MNRVSWAAGGATLDAAGSAPAGGPTGGVVGVGSSGLVGGESAGAVADVAGVVVAGDPSLGAGGWTPGGSPWAKAATGTLQRSGAATNTKQRDIGILCGETTSPS